MIEMKKILYPTDFSEFSEYALPYVLDMAKKFSSDVVALHVLTPPTYAVSPEFAVDLTEIQKNMQAAAEKSMEKLLKRFDEEGITVRSIIQVGTAFAEIVATARDEDSDLIILATHGYGAVKHMLLGSTTEKVVRKAPCPVLTIRHPEHEFVHPSSR